MSVWRFLKDRLGLLAAFAAILVFCAASVRLGESRALYPVLTGGVIAVIYLVISFVRSASHLKKVSRAASQAGTDWISALPAPETGEQRVYHDALLRLSEASEARLSAVKAQSAEEVEFLTLWVHEIKTPIASAKLLLEAGLNHPDEQTLYAVSDELARIEDYVQQSLFYVRAGDFAADYRIDGFPLSSAVEAALQNEYATIRGKRLSLALTGLEYEVDSDEKWLSFIIKQLLDNAVKYSPAGGTIRVAAEQDEKQTRLTVSDEGAGIRSEDVRRVFRKGFTGGNGRVYYNSTGIGLYLSLRLAEKLGHRLTVSSECGKGTSFTLSINRDDAGGFQR